MQLIHTHGHILSCPMFRMQHISHTIHQQMNPLHVANLQIPYPYVARKETLLNLNILDSLVNGTACIKFPYFFNAFFSSLILKVLRISHSCL